MKKINLFYMTLILTLMIMVGTSSVIAQESLIPKTQVKQDTLSHHPLLSSRTQVHPQVAFKGAKTMGTSVVNYSYIAIPNQTLIDVYLANGSTAQEQDWRVFTSQTSYSVSWLNTSSYSTYCETDPFAPKTKNTLDVPVTTTFTAPSEPGIHSYTKTTTETTSDALEGCASCGGSHTSTDSHFTWVINPKTGRVLGDTTRAANAFFTDVYATIGTDTTIESYVPYFDYIAKYKWGDNYDCARHPVGTTGTYVGSYSPYPIPGETASLSIENGRYTTEEVMVYSGQEQSSETLLNIRRTFHVPKKAGRFYVFETFVGEQTGALLAKERTHSPFGWRIIVPDTCTATFYHEFENTSLKNAPGLPKGRTPVGEPAEFTDWDYDFNSKFGSSSKGLCIVCADGTESTTIVIADVLAKRCNEFEYRLSSSGGEIKAGDAYSPSLGGLRIESASEDSVVLRYRHPQTTQKISTEFYLTVKDPIGALGWNADPNVTESFVLKTLILVYPAPVLFIHGQWDNASCFQSMEDYLINEGWDRNLIYRMDYSGTNDAAFTTNVQQNTMITGGSNGIGINAALSNTVKAGYSAGKITLVGHSMGGILSRLYLQSTPGGIAYRGDVNRLITLNTPHLGAQIGDKYHAAIVNQDEGAITQMSIIGSAIGHDIIGPATAGSVRDLGTQSDAMRNLLNYNGIYTGTISYDVPCHAVITTAPPTDFRYDAYNPSNPGFPILLGLGVWGFGLIDYTLTAEYPSIFNCEESDLTVPFSSQRGNLASGNYYSWPTQNQIHASAPRNAAVQSDIARLLIADPNGTDFIPEFQPIAGYGFQDPSNNTFLYYDPSYVEKPCPRATVASKTDATIEPVNLTAGSAITSSLSIVSNLVKPSGVASASHLTTAGSATITSPANGEMLQSGGSAQLQFTQSGAVARKIVSAIFPNVPPVLDSLHIITAIDTIGSATVFNLIIPREAAGKAKVVLIALDSTGSLLSIDSVQINITVPSQLSSITTPYNSFSVPTGKKAALHIDGNYSDDLTRDITGIAGLALTSSNSSVVRIEPNQSFTALTTGTATITATYQGQQTTATVEVYPATASATSSTGGNGDGGTTPKSDNAVKSYSLSQNYPNPFNPATRISFSLPGASLVKLKVYDVLGRVVKVLVDEKRDAGRYEVSFDGSKLASGVYFYRLQSGNFIQSRKMILVK